MGPEVLEEPWFRGQCFEYLSLPETARLASVQRAWRSSALDETTYLTLVRAACVNQAASMLCGRTASFLHACGFLTTIAGQAEASSTTRRLFTSPPRLPFRPLLQK